MRMMGKRASKMTKCKRANRCEFIEMLDPKAILVLYYNASAGGTYLYEVKLERKAMR
jgi:hypothetical protein